MKEIIRKLTADSIAAHQRLLEDASLAGIEQIAQAVVAAYRAGHKVIVFGNGGSASDAQHLAAELVVRFEKNRAALPALALTTNTATLTATGNDFSFEDIFSRQVEAFAQPGDVVIGISTSGTSPNVVKALDTAKKRGAVTVGFTGENGRKLKERADICFCAPAAVTARIQECHILAVHILATLVEGALFEN
jgi:D-sedoheptulose 7-phosphate isomerase